jgi:hypothetical protein
LPVIGYDWLQLAHSVQHFGGKINGLADGAKILAQSNFDPDSASLRHRNAEDGEKLA